MYIRSVSSFFLASVLATTTYASLLTRNNPPQPPCAYSYSKFVYSGCYHDAVSSRALPFMAELEFNNVIVEQCQCYCGASVASTAAPETDCNLPCNGDNTQACGGQDRISVYKDPTFPDADDIGVSSDYLSLGCYTEGTSGRSLDYSQWDYLNVSAMTTETCLTACGAKGYPFVGTEFGRECYCGGVLGNGTAATDASACSTACTGNSTQFCGGPDHLSLYVAKNLESTQPCERPILSSSSTSSTSTSPPTSSSTSKSVKTTSTKCVGYNCPKTTSCKTSSTPVKTSSKSTVKTTSSSCKTSSSAKKTTSTSIKKTSTLKTTTSCKTTSSPKRTSTSSHKSSSTKHGGW